MLILSQLQICLTEPLFPQVNPGQVKAKTEPLWNTARNFIKPDALPALQSSQQYETIVFPNNQLLQQDSEIHIQDSRELCWSWMGTVIKQKIDIHANLLHSKLQMDREPMLSVTEYRTHNEKVEA